MLRHYQGSALRSSTKTPWLLFDARLHTFSSGPTMQAFPVARDSTGLMFIYHLKQAICGKIPTMAQSMPCKARQGRSSNTAATPATHCHQMRIQMQHIWSMRRTGPISDPVPSCAGKMHGPALGRNDPQNSPPVTPGHGPYIYIPPPTCFLWSCLSRENAIRLPLCARNLTWQRPRRLVWDFLNAGAQECPDSRRRQRTILSIAS